MNVHTIMKRLHFGHKARPPDVAPIQPPPAAPAVQPAPAAPAVQYLIAYHQPGRRAQFHTEGLDKDGAKQPVIYTFVSIINQPPSAEDIKKPGVVWHGKRVDFLDDRVTPAFMRGGPQPA